MSAKLSRWVWPLLLMSASAQAGDLDEPRPPSGLGATITGAILTGVGGLNLATAPVCHSSTYEELVGSTGADACLATSLVLGVGGLGAGIPLWITGARKYKKYKAWKADRSLSMAVLPAPGGTTVALSGRF